MKAKTRRRSLGAVLMALALGAGLCIRTAAEGVPTDSYTYWQQGDKGYKQMALMRPVYEVETVIDGCTLGIGALEEPKYLDVDEEGTLYIMDSRRLVLVGADGEINRVVNTVAGEVEDPSFAGAKGVSVSRDRVCIADTERERVLVCDRDFTVQKVITRPDSYLIPEDFRFAPIRAVTDDKDFLYVLCDGSFYGAMVFSDTYEFLGFFGSNLVESSFLDTIQEWLTSLFTTDEKAQAQLQKLPYQITDMTVGPDGFLYTTTEGHQWGISRGELRKMGPGGGNVLTFSSQMRAMNGDNFNFADNDYAYTTLNVRTSPAFAGVDVDGQGFIYAADRSTGKIFVYDSQCHLMTVFGGGAGSGDQRGAFVTPLSLVASGDRLYVLDTIRGNVTVFRLTPFGRILTRAAVLTNEGSHREAVPLWQQVLGQEKNCQLAYMALGQAALYEKDYQAAMDYARKGLDQQTYISAFTSVKKAFLEQHFAWIFLLGAGLLTGLAVLFTVSRKRKLVFIRNAQWHNALSVLFHPFESYGSIRQTPHLSMAVPTVLVGLFFIGKVAEKECAGFMYELPSRESVLLFTLAGTVGIVALGVFCNWGLSVLLEGKGRLPQIYCAVAYSLVPQIIGSVLYILLTYAVEPTGSSVAAVLSMIINLITVLWLLIGLSLVHDFSFFKAIGSLIGTILGMCLAGFVLFLLLVLAQDFVMLLTNLYREAFYR